MKELFKVVRIKLAEVASPLLNRVTIQLNLGVVSVTIAPKSEES